MTGKGMARQPCCLVFWSFSCCFQPRTRAWLASASASSFLPCCWRKRDTLVWARRAGGATGGANRGEAAGGGDGAVELALLGVGLGEPVQGVGVGRVQLERLLVLRHGGLEVAAGKGVERAVVVLFRSHDRRLILHGSARAGCVFPGCARRLPCAAGR